MTSVVSLYLSRRRRDDVRTSFAICITTGISSRNYRQRLFTTRTHARAISRITERDFDKENAVQEVLLLRHRVDGPPSLRVSSTVASSRRDRQRREGR